MRIGTTLAYTGGFRDAADEVVDLERAGLDLVIVPEAYAFDAVSQLGYLAARTTTVELASGVLQLHTRTPTMTAMTAAGLDEVSGGRFVLGLGVSGPQVVEGFHGVPYDHPLGRTREVIEICRQVWRRDRLEFVGQHYSVPLQPGWGTGLAKSLRLAVRPVRDRIPVMLAAAGPRNVALAAELAERWLPPFLDADRWHDAFAAPLAEGGSRRDPELGPLDVVASPGLSFCADPATALDLVRPRLALAIGGMGARGQNFYHKLATAYGYGREADAVQEHYLGGRTREAERALPEQLLRSLSLVGSIESVRDRIAQLAESGVTTLNVRLLDQDRLARIHAVETLRSILPS